MVHQIYKTKYKVITMQINSDAYSPWTSLPLGRLCER
jgi:hypothetical protein